MGFSHAGICHFVVEEEGSGGGAVFLKSAVSCLNRFLMDLHLQPNQLCQTEK